MRKFVLLHYEYPTADGQNQILICLLGLCPCQPLWPQFWLVARMCMVAIVVFAGTTSFMALLQIVTGIHLMLRQGQVGIESDLKDLNERYHL